MVKNIVHYDLNERKCILIGHNAIIHPLDHPSEFVSNEDLVETSKVISIDANKKDFETENTLYVGVHKV